GGWSRGPAPPGRPEQDIAHGHGGEAALVLGVRALHLVGALAVGPAEAGEGDDGAAGGELGVLAGRRRTADAHGGALALGVLHLRGDGAAPDEVVQAGLVR